MANPAPTVEQNVRFYGRNQITNIGNGNGQEAAVQAAKGFLQAAIDELITMLGEKEAYAIAQARVDLIVRPTDDQVKAWAPR